MGIIRGGDAEYQENAPTLQEKTEKIESSIGTALKENDSVLKLSGKYLATDEVSIICRSAQVEGVKILDLSDNQIGDEAVSILLGADNLCGLEELYLGVNFITGEGILEAVRSGSVKLNNLKVLAIPDNKLTDACAAEIVRSPGFGSLETLDLGWNETGNATAKALGETDRLPRLKKLDLERGYIDAQGIADFIKGGVAGQLEELNLSANKLDDEALAILAAAPTLSSLKVLRLSQNQFSDPGAKALGESTVLCELTHLYMGRNLFGKEGAQAVYETKTLTHLKTLVIQEGVETNPGLVNYSRPELLRPEDP